MYQLMTFVVSIVSVEMAVIAPQGFHYNHHYHRKLWLFRYIVCAFCI